MHAGNLNRLPAGLPGKSKARVPAKHVRAGRYSVTARPAAEAKTIQNVIERADLVVVFERLWGRGSLLGARALIRIARRLLSTSDTCRRHPQRMQPDLNPLATRLIRITSGLCIRQRQVLEELKLGRSEKQIANTLKISRHTVHSHVKAVYNRFSVESREELLGLWITAWEPEIGQAWGSR